MTSESLLLSFAIITTSFWGSWHCAAMCGPVASLMAHRKSLITYHIGRGISYTVLGGLGGFLGSFFLKHDFYIFRFISAIIFSLMLVLIGIKTYRGTQSSLGPQFKFLKSLYSESTSGMTLGLLSVFLPCGWLYSYLFAAVATKSSISGALVMALFWLGGLPAMNALSLFVKKSIQLSAARKQKVSGLILVSAGLYSVFSFFFLTTLGQ